MARKDSPLTCRSRSVGEDEDGRQRGEARVEEAEERRVHTWRSVTIHRDHLLSGGSSRHGIYAFRRRLKTLMYTASYNVAIAADGIMVLVPRMTSYVCDGAGLSVIIYRPIPEWPWHVGSFRESSYLDGISVRDLLPFLPSHSSRASTSIPS